MKNKTSAPPYLASWIIKHYSLVYYKHQALGDLEELFYQISKKSGIKKARRWYWRQSLKSIPHLFNNFIYWSTNMFKSYWKFSLRNMKKNKGYSIINISGLAVGMACTILILLWVKYELSYDKFHKNANNLCRVAFTNESKDFYGAHVPGLLADFVKNEYPEIINAANLGRLDAKLTNEDKHFISKGFFVHPSFFEIFTFPFIAGDSKTAFENPLSIVLTEEMADKLFGTTDVVGKTVRLNDRAALTITGVVNNLPQNSTITFEILLPFRLAPRYLRVWDNKAVAAYVLLQEGIAYQEISDKIINVYNDHNPGAYKNNLFLQPFTDIHLYNLDGGGLITYIYIFSAMAVVILLIACINFMNLSTARSEKRFKEIGLKKVSGSSRMQLIIQFLSESVFLSFIALFLAVLLVSLLLPQVNNIIGRQLNLDYSGSLIAGFIGIAVLTGILAGSYPAFYLSSFNPVEILNRQFFILPYFKRKKTKYQIRSFKNISLRKILVVVQFSLSILFIICAMVIFKQLDYIRNRELGYNKDNVIMVPIKGTLRRNCEAVKRELLKNDKIESAAASMYSLERWVSSAGLGWPGKTPDQIFDIGFNWIDYDYLETLQMEMADGRFFSREFQADFSDAFIVNEAAVRAMGLKDPVGKRITRMPDSRYEDPGIIIGVIKDYHTESLHSDIRPFLLMLADNYSYLNIRINSDDIPATISFIEKTIKKIAPSHPFEFAFLDEQINNLYRTEYMTGNIVAYITFLAIFISCLGLLGLASFSVEQRTKEIGIRKVLGSSAINIAVLITKDFIKWVLIANIIAWPAAWYAMNKWLQNFTFKTLLSWDIFIISGLLALLIALLTVGYQSVKAGGSNPVEALRYE